MAALCAATTATIQVQVIAQRANDEATIRSICKSAIDVTLAPFDENNPKKGSADAGTLAPTMAQALRAVTTRQARLVEVIMTRPLTYMNHSNPVLDFNRSLALRVPF